VLGVTGGIASYKACTVARRLTEAGALVDVVLTAGASHFVGAATFEGLTSRPVLSSLWERGRALAHITLGRDAELIVVAPATANLLARAAQGLADDLLTAILLARAVPVLAAPAMNDRMFAHPATQANLATLRKRGWSMVGPAVGALAEGPSELPGRMSEPEEIVAWAERLMRQGQSTLAGRRVVVTAGPTREALDPVRVITNRSSGRMGYALAEAAFARGADVLLISGPTALTPPPGPEIARVETTDALNDAVAGALKRADVLVMAAAPADFQPTTRARTKRDRVAGARLSLEPTPDILEGTIALRRKGAVIVGFALESGPDLTRAHAKRKAKALDLLVVNRADEPGAGTEADTNRVTLLSAAGIHRLPMMSKRAVAEQILDTVEALR
jgi:phosphopantothenoylcysteine decarboxylase/phosphopantothenate--cysteine ligase